MNEHRSRSKHNPHSETKSEGCNESNEAGRAGLEVEAWDVLHTPTSPQLQTSAYAARLLVTHGRC
jgi:hypothetical protein